MPDRRRTVATTVAKQVPGHSLNDRRQPAPSPTGLATVEQPSPPSPAHRRHTTRKDHPMNPTPGMTSDPPDPMQPVNVRAVDDARVAAYADAVGAAYPIASKASEHRVNAVLAVADAEQADLRAEVARLGRYLEIEGGNAQRWASDAMTAERRAEVVEAEVARLRGVVERLREWRKRILDEGFGYDDAEDSAAEVLEWAPTWMAQRIGAEYRLEAAEADNARLRETLARVRALCKNTDGEWLHTRLRRTACWRVHRRPVRARRGWCRVTPAEPTPEAVEALAIAMREADIARQIAKDPHGIASADTPRTAAADALAFLAKHPEYVPGLAWESRRWDVATRRETVRRRVVGPWQVVPDGD